jgi:8-oxo-dGTP pyrophosphatase MutT (NUDIX family)
MADIWDLLADLPPVAHPAAARAAVLVPLYRDGGGTVRVVLTKRPDDMPTHPGDVVFPGGYMIDGEDPVQTAIREVGEEVGIPEEAIEVIGGLTPIRARRVGVLIVPVVARVERPAELRADPREVDAIIEPALDELLDESRWRSAQWEDHKLWFFDFPQGILWGATAFMVRELLGLIRAPGAASR